MLPDSVRPSEFEKLIVSEDEKFCDAVRKTFIELPILLYRLTKYMYSDVTSGTPAVLSAEFGADICNAIADCPDDTTTTT